MKSIFLKRICPNLHRYYIFGMMLVIVITFLSQIVLAADTEITGTGTIWQIAEKIIKEVYTGLAGISTMLAGLMSAVAVVGAKMSNNVRP